MADQLETSKIDVLALAGSGLPDNALASSKIDVSGLMGPPSGSIEVTKLDVFALVGTCPPPGPFTNASVGDIVKIGCGLVQLTEILNDFEANGNVIAPLDIALPDTTDDVAKPVKSGDWTLYTPSKTLGGLSHLNGKVISAVADGLVYENLGVVGGQITLPRAAAIVVAGLGYIGQLQTLYLNVEGLQRGSMQGKRKLQPAVTLRLDCTAGLEVGIDFEHLSPVVYDTSPYSAPGALFTGDQRHPVFTDWNTEGQICVQQNSPLPATILGIIAEVVPGDTTE